MESHIEMNRFLQNSMPFNLPEPIFGSNLITSLSTPSLKIDNYWTTPTPTNNPDDLLFALVDLLMLGPRWNKRKIARAEFLRGRAVVGDYSAVAGFGEDDCVLFSA